MARTHRSIASVLLAGVLFGTAGTAGALGPDGTTALGVGALRLIIGAVALLVVLAALGTSPRQVIRLWRNPPIVAAAMGAAIFQLCFFTAVEDVGVGLATLLTVGSGPIFAGLLGWGILHHRPTGSWALATVICITGLILRSSDQLGDSDGAGIALALAAGLASATWTVSAKHQYDRGAGRLELPAATFALGGLMLVPLLLAQPLAWLVDPAGLALVLYLGVATMAIANVVLSLGLSHLSPGPVTTLMLSDPLVATLLGVVVLGEALSGVAWVGVLLVFAGLVLQGVVLARGRAAGTAVPLAPRRA